MTAPVEWEGNEAGLKPFLSPEDERALGAVDVPALLDALEDEDRFVAAHVALTRRSGVSHETFPTWNGLAVTLRASGEASVDPAQRARLAERWRRWYASDPQPERLPEAQ